MITSIPVSYARALGVPVVFANKSGPWRSTFLGCKAMTFQAGFCGQSQIVDCDGCAAAEPQLLACLAIWIGVLAPPRGDVLPRGPTGMQHGACQAERRGEPIARGDGHDPRARQAQAGGAGEGSGGDQGGPLLEIHVRLLFAPTPQQKGVLVPRAAVMTIRRPRCDARTHCRNLVDVPLFLRVLFSVDEAVGKAVYALSAERAAQALAISSGRGAAAAAGILAASRRRRRLLLAGAVIAGGAAVAVAVLLQQADAAAPPPRTAR